MYRLLGEIPASPQKQQTPSKSNRQRSGNRLGKSVEGAVEITTAAICWEASDQRRDTKRHLKEWRFVRSVNALRPWMSDAGLRLYCGMTQVGYLHCFAGACTIEIAYQAADSEPPEGVEKARR